MLTDLPEAALLEYRSDVRAPDDFDEFWRATLAEAAAFEQDVRLDEAANELVTISTWDMTFIGAGGAPVRAWLRAPRGSSGPLPAVIEFVGYGGGRGTALQNLLWSSAGFAHVVMDTRGQGSGWSEGVTPDPEGSGPSSPGFLTRGLPSRETYYYRRVFTDAVRLVEAVAGLPLVDPSRITVLGGSQGGGIALATAALSTRVDRLIARVPFLSDIPRALAITAREPYAELPRWLAQHRSLATETLETLRYFDGVSFASRATVPAHFTAALMDPVCPPSTVFGAFHAYTGPKTLRVWPHNGHEGGGTDDDQEALDLLRRSASPTAAH